MEGMAALRGHPNPACLQQNGVGEAYGWRWLAAAETSFSISNWSLTPTASWGSALGLQAAWSWVYTASPTPELLIPLMWGEAQVRLTNSQKWDRSL